MSSKYVIYLRSWSSVLLAFYILVDQIKRMQMKVVHGGSLGESHLWILLRKRYYLVYYVYKISGYIL